MSPAGARRLRPLVHFALASGICAIACSSDGPEGSDSHSPSVNTGGVPATTGGTTGVGGLAPGAAGALTGSGGGSTVVTTTVCATAAETAAATLTCPDGSTITSVDFASFGTSTGECGGFARGTCHAANSLAVLEAACLGQSTCAVDALNEEFGGDPCSFVEKNLNVQVTCTETSGSGSGGSSATGGSTGTGGLAEATGGAASGGAATGGTGGSTGGSASGGTGSGGSTSGVVGTPIGFATLNGGTSGGVKGQTVTVSTLADLKKYAESSDPYVILVQGTISNGSAGGQVNVKSNKSIVGLGSTAFLQGVGIQIKDSNNVILQNLKITLVGTATPSNVNGGDAIVINGTSKNVWIDHCEIYSEDPLVQKNIDKYDGLLDIRDQTGFITVSWSYLHDHHKGCLVGAADTDLYADRKITYHHNYFRKIVKRMPMYRGATGHFFNNYINGVPATEASFVVKDTCLRIEKNVYENVKYAIYSGDSPGKAERIDNIATQARAWPSSCTANIAYDYASALTNTNDVKSVVPAGAGVGKL